MRVSTALLFLQYRAHENKDNMNKNVTAKNKISNKFKEKKIIL